jgi:hypothetical protein
MRIPIEMLDAADPGGSARMRRQPPDDAAGPTLDHHRQALWSRLARLAGRACGGLVAASLVLGGASGARAQDAVLAPGDAVVTGFSGITPSNDPVPPGGSPLDGFFIDMEGPSAQVLSLGALGRPPEGQLASSAAKLVLKAKDIGQVFAITLDDGLGAGSPNIYLGATSAYGIHIARPDPADPARMLRLRTGHAEAQWMPGMFAGEGGGNPGSIIRVDGKTGTASVFATLPANSGAGIGDIVFNKASKHLYASDLDTGLIHRFDANGLMVYSFDHGVAGRPAKGLAPVTDNGAVMSITDPAFDTEDTSTWGFTQPERMVYGMAVHQGRLFYAVAGGQQVFSVGLKANGGFAGDPRWELDVTGLPGDGPITDILFDGQGRMYLAQRGTAKGSYAYAEFTETQQATVLRYRLESPDDPATESRWVSDAESYAVGTPEPHQNSNGGIALGYALDEQGKIRPGQRDGMLWSTGEKLRTSSEDPTDPAAEIDVHGLQGNPATMVRPENEPPKTAYFVDYDGLFNDPEKAGHIGDVEIWQPASDFAGAPPTDFPPDYVPPFVEPPTVFPPPPPPPGYDLNLRLTKRAQPGECFGWGAFWRCHFRINVRNTSLEHEFSGPIRVQDELINLPAGSLLQVPQAPLPWSCWWVSAPNRFACQRNAFLAPGAAVGFNVFVLVPRSANRCRLSNVAEIMRPFGGTWQNTDPLDDVDGATAIIPDPNCRPDDGTETNLKIRKWADPATCWDIGGGDHYCRFKAIVWNAGPGIFNHKLSVQDNPTPGTLATFGGNWTCVPNGPGHRCDYNDDPETLFPFESRLLTIGMEVPLDVARANNCRIRNIIRIETPHGAGHPMNTVALDDGSAAVANIPAHICTFPVKAANIECPPGFKPEGRRCVRKGGEKQPIIDPVPIPPPPPIIGCPDGMRSVAASRVVRMRQQGWTLVRLQNGRWCGRPGETVEPPPETCPTDTRRVSPFAVARLRRQGWTLLQLRDGQWCGRPGETVEPITCPPDFRKVSSFQARRLRGLGWTVIRRTDRDSAIWCARPPADPPKPPCRGGKLVNVDGRWMCVCSDDRIRQSIGGGGARCLPRPEKTCARGERSVTSQRQAASLSRQGYNVRQVSRRLWCVSGEAKVCPPGTKGSYPACLPIVKPCPPGTTGKFPRCVPIVRPCPPGTTGKFPRCRPIVRPCPPGTTGKFPRCRPIVRPCPPGTTGKFPRCRPIVKRCPPGMIGSPPRCRRPVIRRCPPGTVGRFPNCRLKIQRPIIKKPVGPSQPRPHQQRR